MVSKNQRTFFRKKRKKFFTGVRKQDPTPPTRQALKLPLFLSQIHLFHVPLPRKIVLQTRLMGTIHLKKLEILGFMQEERDYNLGRVKYKFTAQCYIPCHSNKVDSTLLQECISAAAICSKCKSSIIRLQLWQDGSQKSGLDEYLGYKMC